MQLSRVLNTFLGVKPWSNKSHIQHNEYIPNYQPTQQQRPVSSRVHFFIFAALRHCTVMILMLCCPLVLKAIFTPVLPPKCVKVYLYYKCFTLHLYIWITAALPKKEVMKRKWSSTLRSWRMQQKCSMKTYRAWWWHIMFDTSENS